MEISRGNKETAKQILDFLLSGDIQLSKDGLFFLLTQQNPLNYLDRVLESLDEKPVILTLEHLRRTSIEIAETVSDQSMIKMESKSKVEMIAPRIEEGRQIDWDFADADTKYLVHGLHIYPARMIPQIANRLIQWYSYPRETVLDPFCGSGSVLVESKMLERHSIGVDINPLAVLIARVKTTSIDPNELERKTSALISRVRNDIGLFREGKLEIPQPYFRNIFHWFKRYVTMELEIIRRAIEDEEDETIQNLYVFSSWH